MRVQLFIQGLRRSGTTFLYDVLLADARFDGYYEPLAAARKAAVGGGSRVRDVDFFAKIREVRRRFSESAGRSAADDERDGAWNFGAPRDAALELARDLPRPVAAYVRFLLEQGDWSVLKFVRAWRKLGALAREFPQAKAIHIVRDPRAVVTSFLFGKGQKNRDRFASADDFFGQRGPAKGNQALQVADALIESGELRLAADATHAAKLLGAWKHHFRSSHDDGAAIGPARYLLLRHEELLERPLAVVDRIYAFLGAEVPDPVRAFIGERLDPRPRIFEPADPRWDALFREVGTEREVREAGYASGPGGAAAPAAARESAGR